MISSPHSSTLARSLSALGSTVDLAPKRSLLDQASHLELKRRQVLAPTQPSKRVSSDPLSTSGSENRRNRVSQSAESAALVSPSSVSDLRVLPPETPVGSGYCGISGASSAPVCSWPPSTPALDTSRSSHSTLAGDLVSQYLPPAHSPTPGWESSRATLPQSISTWPSPDFFHTTPTTTMSRHAPTSEHLLQPVRSRTCSMPSVRRPTEELWRSDSGSTQAIHAAIDAADPPVYPAPPGLSPPRPELSRSNSDAALSSLGSLSLSLALGSQPLRVSEHSKAVPPIGAERNRAVSMTSHHSPTLRLSDPPQSLASFPLLSKPNNGVRLPGRVQSAASPASVSREDLTRLLRHAVQNKHAPKVISPLSPLRTATPACELSTDPAYQRRMPSLVNSPSPRYAKCPPRRARTICDGYQSPFDWDTTCMHCQECKRDTVRKKLLALRYRRQHHHQRGKLHALSFRGTPAVDDQARVVLANRIREAFAYEVDEEEKSLWEEVAAATGAGGPLSFSRAGVPSCGAFADRYAMDDADEDNEDDGDHRRHLLLDTLPDESASLFRDVTVY